MPGRTTIPCGSSSLPSCAACSSFLYCPASLPLARRHLPGSVWRRMPRMRTVPSEMRRLRRPPCSSLARHSASIGIFRATVRLRHCRFLMTGGASGCSLRQANPCPRYLPAQRLVINLYRQLSKVLTPSCLPTGQRSSCAAATSLHTCAAGSTRPRRRLPTRRRPQTRPAL